MLDSDLLSLLNLRYLLSAQDFEMDVPNWKAIYRDEAVAIWENGEVMPRAFIVDKPIGVLAGWRSGARVSTSTTSTSRRCLACDALSAGGHNASSGREKFVDVSLERDSWLVVSESYAPGWRVFARPFGAGEDAEFGLEVRLVLANLQGVELPPGDWTLRLIYSPASVSVGMFASSISVALMVFLLGAWFWRVYIGLNSEESSSLAKVARNSIAPIILNLFNRGIDFIFAIVMYRLLLPAEVGIYSVAVVLFVACDIFTNFGLDLFLIREASQQRARAGRYLYHTSFFRLTLSMAGAPLLAGGAAALGGIGRGSDHGRGLGGDRSALYWLVPASLSKGMTSLFYANEQAEKPAAIATITSMNKAVFGVIALLLNYGIIGLAAVSIFNNVLTLLVLLWAGRKLIGSPWRMAARLDAGSRNGQRELPVLLNHLLATIFFQVDILILQAIRGAETVAQYSTSLQMAAGDQHVPAFFTQALFPVLSRQATDDRAAFSRSFRFGIKLLFALTLPLAVAFTALAEPLTLILGGARYLPLGADALRLMIWSIPLGWMNSLTQYALIGLGLQRMITRAFIGAVLFNVVPMRFSFRDMASRPPRWRPSRRRLALFIPFIWLIRVQLDDVNITGLIWRPLAALVAMLGMLVLTGAITAGIGAGRVGLPGRLAAAAPRWTRLRRTRCCACCRSDGEGIALARWVAERAGSI